MVASLAHPWNAVWSTVFDVPMSTVSSEPQLLKAPAEMVSMLPALETLFSTVHPLKASVPTDVTCPRSTFVRVMQFSNAPSPIVAVVFPIALNPTSDALMLANAPSAIEIPASMVTLNVPLPNTCFGVMLLSLMVLVVLADV